MKEDERKIICQNWVYLIQNLTAKDITPYFIEAMILTPDDDETIKSSSTLKDQNDAFLKMICRKGVNSFDILISALRRENDDHTATLLENGIKKEGTGRRRSEPDQSFCAARCPQCSRELVCPDCSPTYDEGFSVDPGALSSSYPPQSLHKVKMFPGIETFSRNILVHPSSITDDATLPKTLSSEDGVRRNTGYEPLIIDDRLRDQNSQQVQFGRDYPDGASPNQLESQQKQTKLSDLPAADMPKGKSISEPDESGQHDYVNTSEQEYENVSPDEKRIELKSPLELPVTEINPRAEKDEHFKYYRKHLRQEKGWYPFVYKVEEIEKLLKDNCTQASQYLIWYEASKFCLPFISVHCEGIIHHFRIDISPKTIAKKRVFYIDSEYEFHLLEDLLEHVKRYGISLDKEFRPEAGLY